MKFRIWATCRWCWWSTRAAIVHRPRWRGRSVRVKFVESSEIEAGELSKYQPNPPFAARRCSIFSLFVMCTQTMHGQILIGKRFDRLAVCCGERDANKMHFGCRFVWTPAAGHRIEFEAIISFQSNFQQKIRWINCLHDVQRPGHGNHLFGNIILMIRFQPIFDAHLSFGVFAFVMVAHKSLVATIIVPWNRTKSPFESKIVSETRYFTIQFIEHRLRSQWPWESDYSNVTVGIFPTPYGCWTESQEKWIEAKFWRGIDRANAQTYHT